MTFGQDLRRARLTAGLSQSELAGDRCSLSYISHLETGRRAPNPDLVRYFEERLDLPAGTLHAEADLSTARQRRVADADLFAAYCNAMESWRNGEYGHALDEAEEVRQSLPERGREDLHTLLRVLLININVDLGRYLEATQVAETNLEAARASGSLTLEVRAASLWARTARLGGNVEAAHAASRTALELTAHADTDAALRADALRAVISTGFETHDHPYASIVEELIALAPRLDRGGDRGLTAWVIGNALMRSDRVGEGIRWHDEAFHHLSPTADFRNWARFPGSSAEERMKAGSIEGVPSLLEESEQRLRLLDNPDEFATLAARRAELARMQGQPDVGVAFVEEALREIDLPARTQGELYLSAAQLHASSGRDAESREAALRAARLFTEAGDTKQAQAAWQLID